MPADVLAALDPEQRQAAEALSGPVCILAGAGTGKTRAITHRIANLAVSGAADPVHVLAVTFTTRAAGEMRSRLRVLGVSGVQARTFHSAALRQLQYFWPRISAGARPTLVESKLSTIRAAAASLRQSLDPATQRDVASEIEWAKAAQVAPEDYPVAADKAGREPPLEFATVAKLWSAYENVNAERGQLDFEDLLLLTAAAIEGHAEIAREVRSRYRVFVVDEYQDVNPLQQRLLEAWLGDRDELCVVGDPHQTIYSFAGASASYLLDFPKRYDDATVVRLVRDYRSTDQIVAVANRLMPTARLLSERGAGPEPTLTEWTDEVSEAAGVARSIKALVGNDLSSRDIAVLFRVNAQSEVYEAALADAGIPYVLRGGERFFQRPEIREAVVRLRGAAKSGEGADRPLPQRVAEMSTRDGLAADPPAAAGAARERWESLHALVALAEQMPEASLGEFVEELAQRAEAQHAPPVDGVTLASLHAAKGLEWEAVFVVGLVEGTVPISHATTDDQIEEERRLLYVGVTRARRHLALSWSLARGSGGRRSRKPSRFLDPLRPPPPPPAPRDESLFERLRAWRLEQARADGIPAYRVFDDKTLTAIATAKPTNQAALARISGVGPKKLELYADEVLKIVRD